ncbi:MAG: riboflavin synthase [Leptotrichiaceae bacterium]|nr:riboflavin synthase [Leptotrichiaceae bacterium]
MFTGLIEEIGQVTKILKKSHGMEIAVKGNSVTRKINVGDSIAVNGVCLTVTSFKKNIFNADIMYETVQRTGLKRIKKGERVNLEKSLTVETFLGGHLVMGDVDCEAEILSITPKGIAKVYEFRLNQNDMENMKYIVEKGRVTIDGASLTIINVNDRKCEFSVSLIPHSLKNIILGEKNKGDFVNIETDLLGKYVEKILKFDTSDNEKNIPKSELTFEFLEENGF